MEQSRSAHFAYRRYILQACHPNSGKNVYITRLIEIAGGHSVTNDIAEEWTEAVLARAPEALPVRGSTMSVEAVRTRPGWLTLPAVKNNRIY